MVDHAPHQPLTEGQIAALKGAGCSAEDWGQVLVAEGFNTACVRDVAFFGRVILGSLAGTVTDAHGIDKPCGLYEATIIDCTIGDGVRIANVGVHVAGYEIADGACIENVGTMQTNSGATFGNGVEVAAVNEGGGREVVIFDGLSSQFAHLLCLHRYRPKLVERLREIALAYAESVRSDWGCVGAGAQICSAGEIVDVKIGAGAIVNGAASLRNGTILSTPDAPTTVGAAVEAEDFIIAEGSSVTGGAVLDKVFVGQGCQVGKQFSAENSLFFANCEAFHGEACSVFAGPYTVTHHKSTLLIAGLLSFYNAGSGTNQSNHMYKLGPVHEGKLERGCKTGSFSYLMWPCRVGPFSVVLGKHSGTFDVADFPFSHIEARGDGRCSMIPGLHLTTVGTVRDGAKWPTRDRRGDLKRDEISFDVFSPYTVGKMLRGCETLKHLQETTSKSIEEVSVGGAMVRRPILRAWKKYYRPGIEMYLLDKVVEVAERAIESGASIPECFAADAEAAGGGRWVDVGGQLMSQQRLADLAAAIERGEVATAEDFATAVASIRDAYGKDEWAWVREAYPQVFEVDLAAATVEDIAAAAEKLLAVKGKFLKLVASDADKEFAELSRTGFGVDGEQADLDEDFRAVRGTYEDNSFVTDMRANVEQLRERIERFQQKLSAR
jgi:hypothetical protein